MTKAYDKLKRLLEELFQFDREDLDFGIYRIMNHRRDEILKFLDHDLLPQVHDAFSEYRAGDEAQVREDLARLEKTLGDAGVTVESSPKYLALKVKLAETKDLSALENEVFSDLYTFFRRTTRTAISSACAATSRASMPSLTRARRSSSTGPTPTSTTSRPPRTSATTASSWRV